MQHSSQQLKDKTTQYWMFFLTLTRNIGQFINQYSTQILAIFILLLLAGQVGAVVNPTARRRDFTQNDEHAQDSLSCIDGECTTESSQDATACIDDAGSIALSTLQNVASTQNVFDRQIAVTSNNSIIDYTGQCIKNVIPDVSQITCAAKTKKPIVLAPACKKSDFLKAYAQKYKLQGWKKVEEKLTANYAISPGAGDYYDKTGTFYEDQKTLYTILKDIYSSAISLRCTLETVLFSSKGDSIGKPFGFLIVTPEEVDSLNPAVGGDGAAAYDDKINRVYVKAGITQSAWMKIVLIHELRHALVSNENFVFNRHIKQSGLFSRAIPYGQQQTDIKEREEFAAILHEIKKNISDYLGLLNKEQQINDDLKKHGHSEQSLTAPEVSALEQYKIAVKNYVAVIRHIPVPQAPLNRWKTEKLIDDTLTIAAPGFIRYETSGQVPLYITKVELINGDYIGTFILSEPDDLRASLLDAIPLIKQYENRYTETERNAFETDALFHQLYQLYPSLFNLLAEKLLAHASARAIPEHNNCIISETRRLGA